MSMAYDAGTVVGNLLFMVDFCEPASGVLIGYDFGIPNKGGISMVRPWVLQGYLGKGCQNLIPRNAYQLPSLIL